MTEVRLPTLIAEEMVNHCLAGRPNEACGLIAGTDGVACKVFRMTNAAASPVRYALDPREQLVVYRELDEHGWELSGVFHSHTRTEAYPSPTDIRLASEDVPYVIVSLAEAPPVIRAFRISKTLWTDETGEVQELPVAVEG
ncbi:MAG: [CysO sulfur-carrier protein]-S-L-cysteine hydrolase [Actinomycetota bacterium]|nr:[CysO sulfur-carrier protein]-S-L-cysteine hydrolase [Actinomycetota bacterium]